MHRVLEGQGLRFHKRNFWTKIATTADVHIADIQGISYFWDAKPQLFIARGASVERGLGQDRSGIGQPLKWTYRV